MTNIGIFDSGLGGIAVLNELSKTSKANFYYLGDNLRVPYGPRPVEEIRKFAFEIVNFLEKFDIDYYIIACNTISVTSLSYLRENFDKKFIPITEMAVEAASSCKGNFLVLATKATIESHYYKDKLEKITGAKVYEKAALDLVKLIEDGNFSGKELDYHLKDYLRIANDKKIENILLGCTHYPLIKESIKKNLTYPANIIDPAVHLAEKIKTDDRQNRVHIYMTKESGKTENLVENTMECDYQLDYIGELS